MNGFEDFKNFCMKYKGAIVGACISIIWLMFYTEYLNKRLLKKNDKKINEEYI